jgi:hypothetical protein
MGISLIMRRSPESLLKLVTGDILWDILLKLSSANWINRLFAISMGIRWPDRSLSGKNPIFAGFLRQATLRKTYWRGLKHLLGPQKHGGWPLKSWCFWRKCAETCMICTLLEIATESREDKEAQQNDFSLFSLVKNNFIKLDFEKPCFPSGQSINTNIYHRWS